MVQRFTCGVYVVNNHDSLESSQYPIRVRPQRKCAPHVGGARRPAETALAGAVGGAAQQRRVGQPARRRRPRPSSSAWLKPRSRVWPRWPGTQVTDGASDGVAACAAAGGLAERNEGGRGPARHDRRPRRAGRGTCRPSRGPGRGRRRRRRRPRGRSPGRGRRTRGQGRRDQSPGAAAAWAAHRRQRHEAAGAGLAEPAAGGPAGRRSAWGTRGPAGRPAGARRRAAGRRPTPKPARGLARRRGGGHSEASGSATPPAPTRERGSTRACGGTSAKAQTSERSPMTASSCTTASWWMVT